ncbi:type 4a pilus biogenesis protein PilO [Acidithiobacillus sp. IBUN Pt1247-S3]|uniref:type 4a pilus biogenesis protein PilO n=1 Tax=Acidithiobacillus sp. IBUN Pt1247-S3 TaxID=3166642 RepID=UPI0034E4757D
MTWDEINNLQLDDLMRLPLKTKAIIAAIIIVLLGAVAWFWFISPENDKYNDLQAQVETLKGQVRQKQLLAADLPAYQAQILEMKHRFQRFLEQLPDRAQIPSLLDDVTLAGRSRGLEFTLFQPLPEVNKNFYAEIPVKINVTGTYGDIGRFAAAVAAMPRIVTINDISITPSASASGTAPLDKALAAQKLEMSCVATTYRYIEAKVEQTEVRK